MNKINKLIIIVALLFVLIFYGCEYGDSSSNGHRFSDEWSYNESYHYLSSTSGYNLYKDLGEHSFGDYYFNDETNQLERKCSVCGYIDTKLEMAIHVHQYGEFVTLIQPTIENTGIMERCCMECGEKESVEIPKLELKLIPKLHAGDTIALIAPASPSLNDSTYLAAKAKLESYGFRVKAYPSVTKGNTYSVSYLALSDEERAEEINNAFKDSEVKGIICLRGGYGSSRTLDLLDYEAIRENPKFFTGYSDITALINAFYFKSGIISYQGFMGLTLANSNLDSTTLDDIEALLFENNANRTFNYGTYISKCNDTVTGTLIGGNLSLFSHLLGSEYIPTCKDKIIFLEDTGEAPYSLDRMFTKLRLFHVFDECKGIVLGYFTNASQKAEIKKLIQREFSDMNIPVLDAFPSGHEYPFISLPIGATVELSSSGLRIVGDVFE